MIPTMIKHMTIPIISRNIIGSLSHTLAMIEIQNGLVYQHTMTRETGAIDTPKFIKKKFACPDRLLRRSEFTFFLGNILIGL